MANGNGDGEGRPGFGGFGFGQAGYREVRKGGIFEDIQKPVLQSLGIWGTLTLANIFVFIVLQRFITNEADWSLFIGILTIGIIGLVLWKSGALRDSYEYMPRFGDPNRAQLAADIVIKVAIAIGLFIALDFYITVIVPQATFTLQYDGWSTILVCALLGGTFAVRSLVYYFVRELTDSLRNSSHQYAIEVLKQQWERERYYLEREPQVIEQLPEPTETVQLLPRPGIRPTDMDKAARMRLAAIDFFEGLVTGDIDMDERGWATGETLSRSGIPLGTTLAKRIRDELLIPAGYLEWINPTNHRSGVRFREGFTPEELLEMIQKSEKDAKSSIRVVG